MIKACMIGIIRGYQILLSPLKIPTCRFHPSCSEYCIEAIRTRGAIRGVLLALWRIVRCNPLSRGGYDPVPPRPAGAGAAARRKDSHYQSP